MLTAFDWIRRCETGAELLATVEHLSVNPDLFADKMQLGPPFSALGGPCQRCWVYAPLDDAAARTNLPARYCRACQIILARAKKVGAISRRSIVIWGYVNRLPRYLIQGEGFYQKHILGKFVQDSNHFLLLMYRHQLKPWLQELALYDGPQLKGHLQIFPTVGHHKDATMGEFLCRAINLEGRFAMDQLRVRFYAAPYQLLVPHTRDKKGLLTFEAAEFLWLLEMAAVFRTMLRPEEQKMLQKLLKVNDPAERQFYWGRFLGYLSQDVKDMLAAWNILQWSKNQVELLYELIDYVGFYQTD
jgi:hypothetical protein